MTNNPNGDVSQPPTGNPALAALIADLRIYVKRKRNQGATGDANDIERAIEAALMSIPAKPEGAVSDPSERCHYKFPGGSIECDMRRDWHDETIGHKFQPEGEHAEPEVTS